MKRTVVLLIMVPLLVACGAAQRRIVFRASLYGSPERYFVVDPKEGFVDPYRALDKEIAGAWSPDCSRIAYESRRDHNREISVINADGSGDAYLTDSPASEWAPCWSPDGARIAYVSANPGEFSDIYVMNADGSGQKRLTDNPAAEDGPAWGTGDRIAFSSDRDGTREIYVMNADGSGQTRLTDNLAGIAYVFGGAAWSPNGKRITFEAMPEGDVNPDIYVMNADGTGVTRLVDTPYYDQAAAWSPDGRRIAFSSDRFGRHEIFIMDADGSNQTLVAEIQGYALSPAWCP